MQAIRCCLTMPPRDESLWIHMTDLQRESILRMAGLPFQWCERRWKSFTGAEQIKILDQINEAASWKDKLQGPA